MKSDATRQYYFLADYYGYTLITSADGTTTEAQYVTVPQQVTVDLQINITGDLVIDSQSKMQINGVIKTLLDRAGDEIYEGGEWQIVQTQPLIDPLGYKDGYRYRAKIIAGDI
jgi:hypothetical protein